MSALTDKLLREISEAVAEENRPVGKIYQEVQETVLAMMVRGRMTKSQTVTVAAGLVKMFELLQEQ